MATIDVLLHGWNFRADVGTIGFCSVVLITGQKRTLVDVGHVGRRTFLQEALQARGVTPDDIDVTVMTHAHWDHNQNFDLFYNAPVLIHGVERKYAHKPHRNDWATPQWTGVMVDHHPIVQEVEEGYEIEPGVSIIHTPGHSPGSIAVMVETDQGLCAVTGDVLHFAGVALSKQNPLVFWNEAEARKSIERIVESADNIYPGHDRPFRLVRGEIEYLAPVGITIAGLSPDMEGVKFDTSPRQPWVMPGIEEQTLASLG